MFSLWKKQRQPVEELTFKSRVETFWKWFAENSQRFANEIEAGRCSTLTEETSAAVKALGPSFAWVYGPGNAPGRHSLTVSSEGNPHLRLLTHYWCIHSPVIKGWDFYPSRQPGGNISGQSIVIGSESYTPLQFWLTPDVDEEKEVIHLKAWSPAFDQLPEQDRWQILFLWLDEALGEDQVTHRLGKIEISSNSLANSFSLPELPEFVQSIETRIGWKPWDVDEVSLLKFRGLGEEFPRSDITSGHTCMVPLWRNYLDRPGAMEDPVKETGAEYCFAAVPNGDLDELSQLDRRNGLYDLLEDALRATGGGICVGSAIGVSRSYLDILLLNGSNSLETVRSTLANAGVPQGTTIHPFAGDSGRILVKI